MQHIHFSYLTIAEIPVLHQTFLKSFADYIIPIQLTEEQFDTKLKREGVDLSFCVGAFRGQEMVGFILTGLGEWQGSPTAYNGGTGVIPAFRGQNLTQKMYEFLRQKLKESGVDTCLLEVIHENESAKRSYQNVGFSIIRSLDCYRAAKQDITLKAQVPEFVVIKKAVKPDWNLYSSFWDIEPTWQNSIAALKRCKQEFVILEAFEGDNTLCGYIAFLPATGGVAQFAVKRDSRGVGIGTALLREAIEQTTATALMFVNIDSEGESFNQFLRSRYFKSFLKQYEMSMPV
jgi:ribosomal protein S18 acetylase RimI-like enzyme